MTPLEPVQEPAKLRLRKKNFEHANFGERNYIVFNSAGCKFEYCSFDNTVISGAVFGSGGPDNVGRSTYRKCTFNNAKIDVSVTGFASFYQCSFEQSDISHLNARSADFVDCIFSGTIRHSIFAGAMDERYRTPGDRTINHIDGNDFSEATLVNVTFELGVDLNRQKLPLSEDYFYFPDAKGALERAAAALSKFPPDAYPSARAFVKVRKSSLSRGQSQILVRLNDYPPRKRPELRWLLESARG
ncbi:pentapeptide repeat-containing protein [Rudaeicoccus suwonensis]|uniref:Pentapeptide repeat protein n=1 Tax=Rudaeicoccus suwonensis TaxID=657409 RepID=A0A561E3A6_9MICO|nr:pentapeptide repeat-containing protein [Rudaeicoccus suwonensis]TWE10092.1 hypothetical protein BKA23_2443 [Rudaeicoccus suwonensis]